MALEWYTRGTLIGASVVQLSLAGFHSSGSSTAPARLLNPGNREPLVTSTVPSARIVAVACRLANCMVLARSLQLGCAAFKSITSAVLVGASVASTPPIARILPSSYITARAIDAVPVAETHWRPGSGS
jgi:hypothetical protein